MISGPTMQRPSKARTAPMTQRFGRDQVRSRLRSTRTSLVERVLPTLAGSSGAIEETEVPSLSPLRVLFASHLSTLNGGAQRSLLGLVSALERTGQIRPVVSVPEEGELTDGLVREGVPFVVVPTPTSVAAVRTDTASGFSG